MSSPTLPPTSLAVHLSSHLPIHPPIHPHLHPPTHPLTQVPSRPLMHSSPHPSTHPSIHLPIYFSIHASTYPPRYPPIHLSTICAPFHAPPHAPIHSMTVGSCPHARPCVQCFHVKAVFLPSCFLPCWFFSPTVSHEVRVQELNQEFLHSFFLPMCHSWELPGGNMISPGCRSEAGPRTRAPCRGPCSLRAAGPSHVCLGSL